MVILSLSKNRTIDSKPFDKLRASGLFYSFMLSLTKHDKLSANERKDKLL
jgi:hypothetical protein